MTPVAAASNRPAGTTPVNCPARPLTGDIDIHEMAWAGDELWLVNTRFACLCTLDGRHSFVPRWRPPFVTAVAAEDRCHLNGLGLAPNEHGQLTPRFVTALARHRHAAGLACHKKDGGVLVDVPSGNILARGLAMPHSPRGSRAAGVDAGIGAGRLAQVDLANGTARDGGRVARLHPRPGGTSTTASPSSACRKSARPRPLSGVADRPSGRPARSAAWAWWICASGRLVAHLEFVTGMEEIFDVQVLGRSPLPGAVGAVPASGCRRADLGRAAAARRVVKRNSVWGGVLPAGARIHPGIHTPRLAWETRSMKTSSFRRWWRPVLASKQYDRTAHGGRWPLAVGRGGPHRAVRIAAHGPGH